MGLPITLLENILHNETVKPGMPKIHDDYIIELNNSELVTIKDLCDFWIEGHKKLFDATKIIDDTKELTKKSERSTEEEDKVSSEQKVETVCASSIGKTKRTRRNNKVKTEKV